MIILEGADSSGKTSLAGKLSLDIGWPLHHSGGPPKSDQEMVNRARDYLYFKPRNIIYDRFPTISDPIYAKVFRRQSPITEDMRRSLSWVNPFIVFCRSPTGALTEQTNLEFDTPEHVATITANHQRLKDAYEDYFHDHPPTITWDWGNYDQLIEAVKLYMGPRA